MRVARCFPVVAGLVSLFGLGSLLSPSTSLAGKSHLNQRSSQHVTVAWVDQFGASPCGSSLPDQGFVVLPADGAAPTVPFVVPEGMAFHVTDVAWRLGGSLVSGDVVGVDLFVDSTRTVPAFRASVFVDTAISTSDEWSGERAMTSGFRVVAPAVLCPMVNDPHAGGGGGGVSLETLILRGYLMKAK